jgi:solute carrier family 35, member E1
MQSQLTSMTHVWQVHPVTHAVANTLKRVVILLACVIFFRTPMTPLCITGSAIAIIGSYFYSLAKGKDKAAKVSK